MCYGQCFLPMLHFSGGDVQRFQYACLKQSTILPQEVSHFIPWCSAGTL